MIFQESKTKASNRQSVGNGLSASGNRQGSAPRFADNRPQSLLQGRLQESADNSPHIAQLRHVQQLSENSRQFKQSASLQKISGGTLPHAQTGSKHSIPASLLPGPVATRAGHYPIQRKKSHAAKYIKENDLGIGDDYFSVKNYIDDSSNPKSTRQGLLRVWNRNQVPIHRIDTPEDLQATSINFIQTDDLSGWDSDEEDAMDMEKWGTHLNKGKIDLIRSGKTPDKVGVPTFDFFDAIRFGRQANKRDDYQRLPMSIDLGGHQIEYDNPGTKDIYATPLDLVESSEPSKSKKSNKSRKFRRAGTSADYNWKTLAKNLDSKKYKNRKKKQIKLLRFFMRRGGLKKLDPHMAEALAAIGSDLMKGSKGGRFFLHKAIRRIERSEKEPSFSEVFSGKTPFYRPAAIGGRSLVTEMNTQIQLEANQLLGVNNCLINAIALAAGLPMPNLGQLMRIRERIGSYGNMLLATGPTIAIIRNVLNIHAAIAVIYQDRASEDFDGAGGPLLIYHVDGNHFTHQMPLDFHAYSSD